MRFESLVERLKASPVVRRDLGMLIGSSPRVLSIEHSDSLTSLVVLQRPSDCDYLRERIFCEGVLVELIVEVRDPLKSRNWSEQ